MRKITAGLFISLDGVVEAPDQWHFPYFNEEMGAAVDATFGAAETMLFGRKTYDSFAGAWPEREAAGGEDAGFAKALGDVRKIVVSNQKLEFTWRNSEQLEGELVEAVTALKNEPGANIALSGSGSVVRQRLAAARDRAAQRDVRARLVLQGGYGLDELALELFGVPPCELELLIRHDDLADVAERLGEAGILAAGRLALGPGPGEAVVGLAAEKHGVGGAEGRVDGRAHLLVEVREVPLIGRLHDAVERDEQACGDLPHGFSLHGVVGALRHPIRLCRCTEVIGAAAQTREKHGDIPAAGL